MISYLLVFIQFFVLGVMFFLMILNFHFSFAGVLLFFSSMYVLYLAVKENPPSNINIRPDIKQNARLVTTGIYRYIRHPMYLSVILASLSFVFFDKDLFWLWCVVVADMVLKMEYEERLWKQSPEYREYSKKSYKIIPFIL